MNKIFPHSFKCPDCQIKIKAHKVQSTFFWPCRRCKGRAVTNSYLKKIANVSIREILETAIILPENNGRPCCYCIKPMIKIEINLEDNNVLELDLCSDCKLVWFDQNEMNILKEHTLPKEDVKKININLFLLVMLFVSTFFGMAFIQQINLTTSFLIPFLMAIFLYYFENIPNVLVFGWPALVARTDEMDTRIARSMMRILTWILFITVCIKSYL